jgi:hypothetical protein
VDGICINQNSDGEKNHQVQRMGKIFESATRVLAWLGPDPEDIAEDCFCLIQETNLLLDRRMLEHGTHQFPHISKPQPISDDKSRWMKLQKLMSLPYFSRLWVVQESGLAKECLLLWGQAHILFAEIVEIALWIYYRTEIRELLDDPSKFYTCADIFKKLQCAYVNPDTWRKRMPLCSSRCALNEQSPMTFTKSLDVARSLSTTDARDHVYGLLGNQLAIMESGKHVIEPDYTQSLEEVYLNTALALLKQSSEAPWVLSSVHHGLTLADSASPSWVPRWDIKRVSTAIGQPGFWYRAGSKDRTFAPEVQNSRYLTTSGFVFDCISWMSPTVCEMDLSFNSHNPRAGIDPASKLSVEILWNMLRQVAGLQFVDLGQLEDAFSLTLVQEYPNNKDVDSMSMEHHRQRFSAYIRCLKQGTHSDCASAIQERATDALRYMNRALYCHGHRLAYTQNARVALVPNASEIGDYCAIFLGLPVPFILRSAKGGRYKLVGDCYVQGVMKGELLGTFENGMFQDGSLIIE